MTIDFTAAPPHDVLLVRRPLTRTQLDIVRDRIHGPADDAVQLTRTVVAAVFDALLTGQERTYRDLCADGQFDRNRYAIPISQYTAIAMAVTDRAYAWGAAVSAGMDLAALMPSAYDDPTVATPDLRSPDDRPYIWRVEIGREAAATISACWAHLQQLADAYGLGSGHYLAAATSWMQQLTGLLTAPPGRRQVVHPDGPLSLYVSTDDGHHYGVVFQPTMLRCTTDGCHATAAPIGTGTGPHWRPSLPEAPMLDHEHQPNYLAHGPQPGSWITGL